jgi:hypothetical protein
MNKNEVNKKNNKNNKHNNNLKTKNHEYKIVSIRKKTKIKSLFSPKASQKSLF